MSAGPLLARRTIRLKDAAWHIILAIGRGAAIEAPCDNTGGKTTRGSTAWQDLARLKSPRVIEIYADGNGRRFRVADLADGLRYLDALTAASTMVDGR